MYFTMSVAKIASNRTEVKVLLIMNKINAISTELIYGRPCENFLSLSTFSCIIILLRNVNFFLFIPAEVLIHI